MKKILVSLTSAMVLFGSVSYANGIAKQDAELLFGNNAQTMQVMAIDKNEMAKTEGEWGWLIPLLIGWGSAVANAPAPGGKTYRGSILSFWLWR